MVMRIYGADENQVCNLSRIRVNIVWQFSVTLYTDKVGQRVLTLNNNNRIGARAIILGLACCFVAHDYARLVS